MRHAVAFAAALVFVASVASAADVPLSDAAAISQQLQELQQGQNKEQATIDRLRAKVGAAPQAAARMTTTSVPAAASTQVEVRAESAPDDLLQAQSAVKPPGAPVAAAPLPAAPVLPNAAVAPVVPALAPPSGAAAFAVPPGGGCAGTGDLAQLLSPACLDSLKPLRGAGAAPLGPTPGMSPVTCSIAVYAGHIAAGGFAAQAGGLSSFQSPSLPRCIEAGARLSHGVEAVIDIFATDESGWSASVTCRRSGLEGRQIACNPQPPLGQ